MAVLIVAGALANKPLNGGEAWVRLNWVLGLRRLGHEVYFVEQIAPAAFTGPDGLPSADAVAGSSSASRSSSGTRNRCMDNERAGSAVACIGGRPEPLEVYARTNGSACSKASKKSSPRRARSIRGFAGRSKPRWVSARRRMRSVIGSSRRAGAHRRARRAAPRQATRQDTRSATRYET